MLISVVIPVYNERDNIATCLRGLATALAGEPHELLVVYDFDEDSTLEGIRAMADVPATLRLVRNRIGKGAANAIRAGFAAAQGDVVVTTMADLSDPPEKILELARKMRESGAAVVAGSRYMPGGSQEGGPLVKRTLSRVAGLSLHWFAGVATHDATNNFKAYSKRFLESVKVEAQGAFDIGLELTVKAHLAGAGVAEVPTSWRDRAAGESRFKVWAWAPKYLKWYGMAMLEPALVWLVWAGFVAWLLSSAAWRAPGSGGDLGLSLLYAWLAGAAIVVAREIRGRMRWWDAALALPWANPRHSAAWGLGNGELALGLALTSTTLMYLFGCGWRACLRALSRSLRSSDSRRAALAVALAVAMWLRHVGPAWIPPDIALDPSWEYAYSHFKSHGMQAGVDYVYTYGPLSHFPIGTFAPELDWTRRVLWEGVIESCGALLVALALVRVGSWVEGTLVAGLLLLLGLQPDAWGSLVCVAAAVVGIRNTHSGWLRAMCLALLATLSLTKFTLLPQAWLAALAICATPLVKRSWWSAAVRALYFAGALSFLWILAGQALTHLPRYVASGIEVSSGYSGAMSRLESHPGFATFGLVSLAVLALVAFARAARGPLSHEARASALVALAICVASYKSNAVRHGFTGSFALVVLVAPFLLPDLREPERELEWLRSRWRRARALRGLAALAILAVAWPKELPLPEVAARAKADVTRSVEWLTDDGRVHERLALELEHVRTRFDLPKVREVVADEPIDLLGDEQALLVLNRFNWRPRPMFQAYSAHSDSLSERNAEFLRGSDAPRFLLQRLGAIDGRYAPCVDTGAFVELLVNWRPLFVERSFLLWERKPAAERRELVSSAVMERELAFGEWLDLTPWQGQDLGLRADVAPSLKGRLRSLAAAAAPVQLEVRLSDGRQHSFRMFPALLAHEVPFSPLFVGQEEVVRWALGQPARPTAMRIVVAPEYAGDFASTARVALTRLEGLPERAWSGVDDELRWSMFSEWPASISANPHLRRERHGERETLVVYAPSELRFRVEPGRYRLRALVGVGEWSWKGRERTDGFSVEARFTGREEPLWQHDFDPAVREEDRAPRVVQAVFRAREAGEVVLSTAPGPNGDVTADAVWWSAVELVPLER